MKISSIFGFVFESYKKFKPYFKNNNIDNLEYKNIRKLLINGSQSELEYAIKKINREEDMVKILNAKDSKGYTLLCYAKTAEAVDLLVDHGTEIHFDIGNNKGTELHILAAKGYYKAIKELIARVNPEEVYSIVNYRSTKNGMLLDFATESIDKIQFNKKKVDSKRFSYDIIQRLDELLEEIIVLHNIFDEVLIHDTESRERYKDFTKMAELKAQDIKNYINDEYNKDIIEIQSNDYESHLQGDRIIQSDI